MGRASTKGLNTSRHEGYGTWREVMRGGYVAWWVLLVVLTVHGLDRWVAADGRHCRGERQGSRASTYSTKIL